MLSLESLRFEQGLLLGVGVLMRRRKRAAEGAHTAPPRSARGRRVVVVAHQRHGRSVLIVWAVLLVSLIGGAVWWVNRGTSRVPEGWETLDATPGFDGWAKKAKDPRSGIVFILVEPGHVMMGSPDNEGGDDEHPQLQNVVGHWNRQHGSLPSY